MNSIIKATFIFLFFLLGFPSQNLVAAGNSKKQSPYLLKAGAAKVDISPENSVPLAGYGARRGRPSKGVHDPIHARAIVLDDGHRKVAICNMDLVITTINLREAVWQRVRSTGLDALLLFATHNHSGIGGYINNSLAEVVAMGLYDEKIFQRLVSKISQAIVEAAGNLRPAAIGQEKVLAPNLSRNRRAEGRTVDPEIGVIKIASERGEPIALLVNFAAHPTILGSENMFISGDFPGYLARYLEEKGGVVVFANGASADIEPRVRGGSNDFDGAKVMGESLGQRVLQVLTKIETKRRLRIGIVEKELSLPSRPDLSPILRFPILTHCLNLLADIWLPEKTLIQVIVIDDILLIGVPSDLGVEVGLEIKARVSPRWECIISHANDYIGYVITRDQYGEGGYEAEMSFYGPELVDLVKGELMRMIGQLDEIGSSAVVD